MTTITMPQLGESVSEGTILKWLKQEGDEVAIDESLCEIETEKVNAEMPSPYAGKIEKILVAEGETVKVGVPLIEIAVTGEAPAQKEAPAAEPQAAGQMAEERETFAGDGEKAAAAPAPAVEPKRESVGAAGTVQAWPPGQIRTNGAAGDRAKRYSPAVLRLAEEHKLDLAQIKGSGIGGRVTRKDVVKFVESGAPAQATPAPEAAPAPAEQAAGRVTAPREADELIKLSPTRRTIGERMRQSIVEQPQAWMMVEVDMTQLAKFRQAVKDQFRDREGVDLTFLPFIVKATVQGLKEHPILNSQWTPDGVLVKKDINIGVAVSTDEGLIVPVIKQADGKSIAGLAHEIAELARKARNRKLALDDVTGGTFTVDNTGAFGSIASAPIVNPPQAAILSSELVVKRPIVQDDDSIAVRHMMNMCISFDHRVVDGADIGGFMRTVKERLQAYGPETPLY
ncbi:MAG TPA: dihydrolipoamide acetyltransferase family protein [Dehalococcoidia bacterium]|nr:dihydrolipoamide acetyltransferase family protein [Dehalococcoidia bacterium]